MIIENTMQCLAIITIPYRYYQDEVNIGCIDVPDFLDN